MFAIYKREIKSYFRSFIGLLFIAATLFFVGLYYTAVNLLQGYPYFSYAISSVIILFLIGVPVLTMRFTTLFPAPPTPITLMLTTVSGLLSKPNAIVLPPAIISAAAPTDAAIHCPLTRECETLFNILL